MKDKLLTIVTFAAILLAGFAAVKVTAQKTRELTQENDDKKSQPKRIALVIGNGAYTKAKPLPNPPNDAADMTKALQNLGFEVISGINQTKRQTESLIRDFGTKLANSGGVGLFYYAGHGIQVNGENYLVPVDADIPEEDEVSYSAVPISLVLTKMTTAKNDLNIVILDACRNNPFARSWRGYRDSSSGDGLAKISPPTGTLVLYATEPGKVASDGTSRNGLFTEALLKQITKPNLEYDQMVKALSADVWQRSNRQQLPWKEGNTLQDFYFVKTEQKTTAATNPTTTGKTVEPNNEAQPQNTVKSNSFAKSVRYDGLYKSYSDALLYWLRFYEDGTVICASTVANATESSLAKWFKKPYNDTGKFIINGSELEFSCTSTYGTVDYRGAIEQNKLNLQSYSHINENRASAYYEFVEFK